MFCAVAFLPPSPGRLLAAALAAAVTSITAVPAGPGGSVGSVGPAAPGVSAPADAGCPWLAPVAAEVVDGFRPPPHPYGPGNRGLEYGVEPGQPVTAVASGTVGFAGSVAGRRYVVVVHARGLRSTYGPLLDIATTRGGRVAAGDPIGAAADGLHLTARAGDRYIDPQPLLDGRCGRVRLVSGPHGSPG